MKRRRFLAGAGLLSAGSIYNGSIFQTAAEKPIIKPNRLHPGDLVALINPAGATAHRADLEIVAESMEALGLEVRIADHVMERYGYLAGSDQERADDLNRQFGEDEVKAVLAVRGGWGCARILPLIDFKTIEKNPKILIGYSDVTALLLAVFAKTGIVTFHGPLGISPWNSFSVEYFRKILFDGEMVEMANPTEIGDNLTQVYDRIQTITPGTAQGRLLGGNLSVLSAIVGSAYLPSWEESILFLEDVGENIYRVDRMLTQLKLAGILDRIRGFIFGKCTQCGPGEGYGSLTIDQLFDDHIKPLKIPAWQGSMIGHISKQFTLAIGTRVEIDAEKGSIRMLEPAVS